MESCIVDYIFCLKLSLYLTNIWLLKYHVAAVLQNYTKMKVFGVSYPYMAGSDTYCDCMKVTLIVAEVPCMLWIYLFIFRYISTASSWGYWKATNFIMVLANCENCRISKKN